LQSCGLVILFSDSRSRGRLTVAPSTVSFIRSPSDIADHDVADMQSEPRLRPAALAIELGLSSAVASTGEHGRAGIATMVVIPDRRVQIAITHRPMYFVDRPLLAMIASDKAAK